MSMEMWVNLFSSVLVMFFLFYVFVKFFLRIFEDRIRFMEHLYDSVVVELRHLVRELHLMRVEVSLLFRGKISDDDSNEDLGDGEDLGDSKN